MTKPNPVEKAKIDWQFYCAILSILGIGIIIGFILGVAYIISWWELSFLIVFSIIGIAYLLKRFIL